MTPRAGPTTNDTANTTREHRGGKTLCQSRSSRAKREKENTPLTVHPTDLPISTTTVAPASPYPSGASNPPDSTLNDKNEVELQRKLVSVLRYYPHMDQVIQQARREIKRVWEMKGDITTEEHEKVKERTVKKFENVLRLSGIEASVSVKDAESGRARKSLKRMEWEVGRNDEE